MGKKDGGIQGKLRFRRTIAAKWEKRTAKSKENHILAVLSKQAAKTKNLTNSGLFTWCHSAGRRQAISPESARSPGRQGPGRARYDKVSCEFLLLLFGIAFDMMVIVNVTIGIKRSRKLRELRKEQPYE